MSAQRCGTVKGQLGCPSREASPDGGYALKIDLHVHTSDRSACGESTEEEMIESAIAHGLDAICFTDHDRLAPRGGLDALNERYAPLRVFGAIEVSVTALDHCLVLGVTDPEIESGRWTYAELRRFVRERDGFMAVCHPFRFSLRRSARAVISRASSSETSPARS